MTARGTPILVSRRKNTWQTHNKGNHDDNETILVLASRSKSAVGATNAGLVLAGLLTSNGTATIPSTMGSPAVGRYNLVSANSQGLPAIVSENPDTGFQQEVTGGHVDLRADRTSSVSTEYRYTISGSISTDTSVSEGTWAISRDTVTFTFRGDHLTGTLSEEVLTVRASLPTPIVWRGSPLITPSFGR